MNDSPSSWWYDPPELRSHLDYGCAACDEVDENGIASPGCDKCHNFDADWIKECSLCAATLEDHVDRGEWCRRKPLEHYDNYFDEHEQCLECVEELTNAKEAA